jgi:hypothetical protein
LHPVFTSLHVFISLPVFISLHVCRHYITQP